MPRRLLLVDLSNYVYRSVHAYAALTHGNTFTGGIYGLMVGLSTAIEDVGATHVVVCADSPPYIRKKEYPEYKSDRSDMDEVIIQRAAQTKSLCERFLNVVGIPLWKLPGFEADDLIAWAVERQRNRFEHVVAASNDSDLFQLFRHPTFRVYKGGKAGIYTAEDFTKDHGLAALEYWVPMLSMIGTHNAVPGIRGIGPVTAAKIVANPFKLSEVYKQHAEVMKRNQHLIRLPHPRFPVDAPLLIGSTGYSERGLYRFTGELAINLTYKMGEAFRSLS